MAFVPIFSFLLPFFLLLLFVCVLFVSALVAGSCRDELVAARRTFSFLIGLALLLASAILLYASVPLYAQLALIALLFLLIVRFSPSFTFSLLAPFLVVLSSARGDFFSLLVLLFGGLLFGYAAVRPSRRPDWFSPLRDVRFSLGRVGAIALLLAVVFSFFL